MGSNPTLVPAGSHGRFPFRISFPVLACAMGPHLHVVAMDELRREMRHVALDRWGEVASPITALPMSHVSGLAPCAGELILAGAHREYDRPVAMGLDNMGAITWEGNLRVGSSLVMWPRPVCVNGQAYLMWETQADRSSLRIARPQARSFGPQASLPLQGRTAHLAAASTRRGIAIARTWGSPSQLEVLRFVDGRPKEHADISDATGPMSPSWAVAGDQYLLLWISQWGHALRVQQLDQVLSPVGAPRTVASVQEPARLHSARFIQGGSSYLAVSYRTVTVGDEWAVVSSEETGVPGYGPRHTYRQFVALYSWGTATLYRPWEVIPPAVGYEAGEWVDDTLVIVHGQQEPAISTYGTQQHEPHQPNPG